MVRIPVYFDQPVRVSQDATGDAITRRYYRRLTTTAAWSIVLSPPEGWIQRLMHAHVLMAATGAPVTIQAYYVKRGDDYNERLWGVRRESPALTGLDVSFSRLINYFVTDTTQEHYPLPTEWITDDETLEIDMGADANGSYGYWAIEEMKVRP